MSFYLSMVQIIWYSHAFFFLKFRVSGTLLFVWPFLYFVLYSWSTANLKSSNVLWSMSWLIHNFVFPKKKKKKAFFFLLTVHCFFYEQFTKFTALFSLTWFTIIHLFLKVFKIKFLLGIFYSPVLPGFFWCNMQIRYYSFSTFAQKWNNAYHKFDFKKFHSASS